MARPIYITVERDGQTVIAERFERDVIKIGRLASAHIKLDEPTVSRIHAVLETSGDAVHLVDMGSLEGTKVNGDKVSKREVAPSDLITVGPYLIQFTLTEEVRAEQPPPVPVPSGDIASQAPPKTNPDNHPITAPRGVASAGRITAEPTVPASPAPRSDAFGPTSGARLPAFGAAAASNIGRAPKRGSVSRPSQVEPTELPQPLPATEPPAPRAAQAWGSVPSNLASTQVPERSRALEVKAVWGGTTVLDAVTVRSEPSVSAGDARTIRGWGPFQRVERCDLEISTRNLDFDSFTIATKVGEVEGVYDVQWPQGASGRIENADGQVHRLQDLEQAGFFEAGDRQGLVRYPLKAEETVFVDHGDITLQMRYVRRAALPPVPWYESINYNWLNTFLLVFFAHVMAVASFLSAPQTQANVEEDIARAVNRFAQIRLNPEQKKKQKSLLASLKSGEKAERAKGKQGQVGKKDAPEQRTRSSAKGKSKEQEANAALDKLLGTGVDGQVASIMGGSGLGGELKNAMGSLEGRTAADARGLGGLGARGSGPGGGGLGAARIGLGSLDTLGRGGGGSSDYGSVAADLGRKQQRDINISAGRTIIRGSLPKEVIKRVIRDHLSQIRYCYERELNRSPGIFGKVGTEFVIGGNGRVQTAKVSETTLNSLPVERCILQKIRTWKFPKPKGGGIVVVKYPFVLKSSG